MVEFADKIIPAAFNAGINYFDVSPRYGDAQDRMGPPLKAYRNKVFLACKTRFRDRAGAEEDLHNSLKILKTDRFDLYQFHSVYNLQEVNQIFGPDGAMEAVLKAKKEGKIRHIGFSAHTTLSALAAMDRFKFDTVMFPINFIERHAHFYQLQNPFFTLVNKYFNGIHIAKTTTSDLGVIQMLFG